MVAVEPDTTTSLACCIFKAVRGRIVEDFGHEIPTIIFKDRGLEVGLVSAIEIRIW